MSQFDEKKWRADTERRADKQQAFANAAQSGESKEILTKLACFRKARILEG